MPLEERGRHTHTPYDRYIPMFQRFQLKPVTSGEDKEGDAVLLYRRKTIRG